MAVPTHHANDEWLLVVSGTPTLRTPEGEQELMEGDVACFLRGSDGAHQVSNGTEAPVRVLMLSTLIRPDIVDRRPQRRRRADSPKPARADPRLLGRRGLKPE